jgi:hypothetical protein
VVGGKIVAVRAASGSGNGIVEKVLGVLDLPPANALFRSYVAKKPHCTYTNVHAMSS